MDHLPRLPDMPYHRDYLAASNIEAGQFFHTLILRGFVVGAAAAVVFYVGRSMINDLLEEVAAGLV